MGNLDTLRSELAQFKEETESIRAELRKHVDSVEAKIAARVHEANKRHLDIENLAEQEGAMPPHPLVDSGAKTAAVVENDPAAIEAFGTSEHPVITTSDVQPTETGTVGKPQNSLTTPKQAEDAKVGADDPNPVAPAARVSDAKAGGADELAPSDVTNDATVAKPDKSDR